MLLVGTCLNCCLRSFTVPCDLVVVLVLIVWLDGCFGVLVCCLIVFTTYLVLLIALIAFCSDY